MQEQEILGILDAGAQYGKVIDRRVRELGVLSELVPLNASAEEVWQRYKAVIISGGPESVYGPTAPVFDAEIIKTAVESVDKPVLGICYGMQLISYHLGGTVEKKALRQDGCFDIQVEQGSKLFKGVSNPTQVLLTHGDSVSLIGHGLKVTSTSKDGVVTSIEHEKAPVYGVQFHPEVDLTEEGKQMISNFLFNVCGFSGSYSLSCREQLAIDFLRGTCGYQDVAGKLFRDVPLSQVLVLVSGGVDSSVCAALLYKALGKHRVHAIHVDSGFMRVQESEQVEIALGRVGIDLKVVRAKETFLNAVTEIDGECTERLCDVISPEVKRKIIGDTFMRICETEVKKLGFGPDDRILLAQGTLRPDLIESASKLASSSAQVIKTHHNDTFLVRQLRDLGRIVEPLKDYHKDEVRQLGKTLGLPDELLWRQPFPGPGLAIRIICADAPFVHPEQEDIQYV